MELKNLNKKKTKKNVKWKLKGKMLLIKMRKSVLEHKESK